MIANEPGRWKDSSSTRGRSGEKCIGQSLSDAELVTFAVMRALPGFLLPRPDSRGAPAVIGLQRRTLGTMLGHALDHRAWDDADGIVRALDAYWATRGLVGEAAAWADQILDATAGSGQLKYFAERLPATFV